MSNRNSFAYSTGRLLGRAAIVIVGFLIGFSIGKIGFLIGFSIGKKYIQR